MKKNKVIKAAMWIISIISLIGTGIALKYLPDTVPTHYDSSWKVDGYGSKYTMLVFPVIIILMSLFWTLLMGYYEKKAANGTNEKESASAASNAGIIGIAGIAMSVMFTVMQAFILYGSYSGAVTGAEKSTVNMGRIIGILLGVIMVVLGNYLPKTRINGTVGIRHTWTMYNDNTWRKAHRFGGVLFMIAGVVIVILSFVISESSGITWVTIAILFATVAITLFYSYIVYKDEVDKNEGFRKGDDQ